MTKSKKPEFRPNDFVVYPAHGVGKIISIEEQQIAGIQLELFVISFEKDKMTLRVPTHKALDIGMRALSAPDVVTKALDTLTPAATRSSTVPKSQSLRSTNTTKQAELLSITMISRRCSVIYLTQAGN